MKLIQIHPKSEPRAPKGPDFYDLGGFWETPFLAAKSKPKIRNELNIWRQNPKASYVFVGPAECAVLPER